MKIWMNLLVVTLISAGFAGAVAAGASGTAGTAGAADTAVVADTPSAAQLAAPLASPSVVYRNEATKRFEVPPEATLKAMAARTGAEAAGAAALVELDVRSLREEAVAVRAGGVRLRLRGGLRSALLAEVREGGVVFTCEDAPAEAEPSAAAVPDASGEVKP